MAEETVAGPPLAPDADLHPLPVPPAGPAALGLVAGGGAVGTALRYLLSEAIPHADGIPAGILVVNLTGAALLGLLVEVLARWDAAATDRGRDLRLLVGTGVLGGYTTYSALATDAARLIDEGRAVAGIGYVAATVLLGAVATGIGILAARTVGRGR